MNVYQDDRVETVSEPIIESLMLTATSVPTTARKAPYLPKLYWEAREHKDYQEQWYPALKKQVDTLIANGTWQLVDKPPGITVIPGQWVLDQKFDAEGEFQRNRARWVACGNHETGNSPAWELYSAVVHSTSVRVLSSAHGSARPRMRTIRHRRGVPERPRPGWTEGLR